MRLYFHHVGETGSKRDFPKTVWNSVSMSMIEENVPRVSAFREPLLRDLRARFPDGIFNCWGVPAGARTVIRHLQPGDAVLLVETIRLGGSVPALCQVQAFFPEIFEQLSRALWGEHHFPYVFFFSTERLSLSWEELRDTLGYKPRFDPRGMFYRVNERSPVGYRSQYDYVDWLRAQRKA
jgi:5-methylcytosine-specific restriction enzyme A